MMFLRSFTRLAALARAFRDDRRGNIAIIFGFAAIPLVIAVGTAVDLSRAYLVKQRLAFALDAAGLAVGSSLDDPTQDPDTVAQNFFAANFPVGNLATPSTPTVVVDESEITVSATASVQTTFMRIAGINQLTVGATAKMIRETNGLELVMALDNTGSMGSGGKLAAMKSAATEMVNILFGDQVDPPLLKIGLVPFAGTVNIGTANAAYVSGIGGYNWGTTSWSGCVMARTYPADVQDTTTDVGGFWPAFYWADHDSYNNWIDGGSYSITLGPPSTKGPNKYCPRAITPLTNSKTTLLNEIDAMWAAGYTHINEGAAWAWRVLSPDAPFTEGLPYGTTDWNKAAVILTDGDNTTSSSVYTAYGYRSSGLLGCTTASCTETALNNRLGDVCTGMKAAGIKVYTITFGSDVSSANKALMESCATDSNKYFHAPDTATIKKVFRAIGAELRKLHISQ